MSIIEIGKYKIKEIFGHSEFFPEIAETGNFVSNEKSHLDEFILKVEKFNKNKPSMNKFTLIDKFGHLTENALYNPHLRYFKAVTILTDKSKKYEIFGEEKTAEEWRKIIFD